MNEGQHCPSEPEHRVEQLGIGLDGVHFAAIRSVPRIGVCEPVGFEGRAAAVGACNRARPATRKGES